MYKDFKILRQAENIKANSIVKDISSTKKDLKDSLLFISTRLDI